MFNLIYDVLVYSQPIDLTNPNSGAAPCTNSDTLPRLSGSLLLSLTCCSPPSLLCGRNSGRLWGRSRGTTNIVIPQVILTFGLGQSNVNLLCVYMGMWNYFPPCTLMRHPGPHLTLTLILTLTHPSPNPNPNLGLEVDRPHSCYKSGWFDPSPASPVGLGILV